MVVCCGRLAAVLMALVTIRAVTSFLTPEQYGELALLITVQMFCGLFLVNPVGQHINLHTHAWWDDGTLMARLKSYKNYVLAVSFIGGAVVLCVGKFHTLAQLFWTVVAVFFMVAAGTWNATLIPMLNMLGFRVASVLWSIITAAFGLISSIILVVWLPSATSWLAGQAIGMVVGALGAKSILQQHAMQSKCCLGSLPLLDRQTALTYCLPLALATGLMWLQLSGYRFVIEDYWGLASLGFMAMGLQLAGQIWALVESLAVQFIYPLFYRSISVNTNQSEVQLAISDLLNTLVPVYFVLAGGGILGSPYLLKLLVAPQFWGALNFVMLGAGIELCRVLSNLLSNAAHVRRNTRSLTLPYMSGAITSLALIYFAGTWKMKIDWAGAALIFGSFAMLITMLISMYKQVRFFIGAERCIVSVVVMLTMALLVIWMPEVSGLGANMGMLLLVGVPVVISMLALLWKNPSTLRLLNVKLRNH